MADGTPRPPKPSVNPGKKVNSGNPVTRPWRPAVGECRPQVVPPRWDDQRMKSVAARCVIPVQCQGTKALKGQMAKDKSDGAENQSSR
jgi:hypothetical protein